MNNYTSSIQLYELLLYVALGLVLFVGFYIVNQYVIPVLKNRIQYSKKYWQKIQIIAWILFSTLFFIALVRANPVIAFVLSAIVVSVGWNFWRNVFAGIIIKFNSNFEVGEIILTDFVKGELKSIMLSKSELINENGEIVIIPNRKLTSVVVTHYYKKSNVQTHSFKVSNSTATRDVVYQLALNCPFISTNQKIEVIPLPENDFSVNASVIDPKFVDEVNRYFEKVAC